MSSRRHGEVTLAWADGDYTFRLAIKQLMELQDACDAGPSEILRRLTDGTWRVNDIRETVRIGLVGGGLEPSKALKLTKLYVDERPLSENILLARLLLMSAIFPMEDDPLGKAAAAESNPQGSEERSPSPPSMDPVLQ